VATGAPDDLLARLRRGEVEAAEALARAYSAYLRAVVRRQRSDRLRAKFDSADVVQSVWVQVVRRLGRDGLEVADEQHLRALLATIARRRLVSRVRREPDDSGPDRPTADAWENIPQPYPTTPSQAVQADDAWDSILRNCPPEHHAVVRLRRDGLPLAEIAERTGLHEGSVRRILRRLARELALKKEPLA
jgi:RNA polymerase sigma-70 factor (ECF subfamily)